MSNIDKDIEKTNAIETFKHWIEYEKANKNKIHKADELIEIQETVLKELETWKKIAENLAHKLMVLDDGCKHIPIEICNEYSNGRCIQCIIDWARKEVDKNDN